MQHHVGSRVACTAWSLAAMCLLSATAAGKAAPITFEELVRKSTVIVVGTVTSTRHALGLRVGTLRTELVLKGTPGGAIVFLDQGMWQCDITGADVGDRALWFLLPYVYQPMEWCQPQEGADGTVQLMFCEPTEFRSAIQPELDGGEFMAVTWSGAGQMRLRDIDGISHAVLNSSYVTLPEDLQPAGGWMSSARNLRFDDFAAAIDGIIESLDEHEE